jgi:hypothetical protein
MITITRGSDPKLVVVLQQKDSCGIMPLSITNDMVISFVYKDLTGVKTKVDPAIEVMEAVYGKIVVNFTDEETEAMRTGNLDFDVYVDKGPERLIWRFVGKVTVQDRVR